MLLTMMWWTVHPESWFTDSCESASFSTASDDQSGAGDPIETVIKGLRSERLFFEPGETNSILEEAKAGEEFPFKESVVLSMESQDPHLDFKKSMEEMVEAHGLVDWEGLEELLSCYLKVNGKSNHGYIVSAFVDLLAGFASSSSLLLLLLQLLLGLVPVILSIAMIFVLLLLIILLLLLCLFTLLLLMILLLPLLVVYPHQKMGLV
ncbi:hypothetical protein OIU78_002326 [Salix suchowensis]|nr:hypothetical protein OIU78_002326 [Salix suchowensis]